MSWWVGGKANGVSDKRGRKKGQGMLPREVGGVGSKEGNFSACFRSTVMVCDGQWAAG